MFKKEKYKHMIDGTLIEIIARCLEIDPNKRSTIGDLLQVKLQQF